jgi:hypothetical protein
MYIFTITLILTAVTACVLVKSTSPPPPVDSPIISVPSYSPGTSFTPLPSATSDNKIPEEITAYFPKLLLVDTSSFTPAVTKDEAVAKAKSVLKTGFKIEADQLPALAILAFYTGLNQLKNPVSNVPAWYIVIKNVPAAPFKTLTPSPPGLESVDSEQLSAVFDATTGSLIYARVDSIIK